VAQSRHSAAEARRAPPSTSPVQREIVFPREPQPASVLDGALAPGETVKGPAIVALPEATLVVAPGWKGRADEAGTMILERA